LINKVAELKKGHVVTSIGQAGGVDIVGYKDFILYLLVPPVGWQLDDFAVRSSSADKLDWHSKIILLPIGVA